MFTAYRYRAALVRVVDGDTVDLDVDLGFHVRVRERFRLYGINAPEVRTRDLEEKARGKATSDRLREILESADEIVVETFKDRQGKFGRWLARLYVGETIVNDLLVEEGLAEYVKYS